MKKITAILSLLLIAGVLQVSAQTKKTKKQPKKTIEAKASVQAKSPAPVEPKTAIGSNTTTNDYYKTALGLKALYGVSVTAKHFINPTGALEAIVQFRHHSGVGSEFNFSGLYEYHGQIPGAEGLRWYAGGGVYAGYFSYSNDQLVALIDESSSFSIGLSGVGGLEYKFKDIPLAISADWQPVFIVNGNSGLASENGGIGVKYTF